MGLSLPHLVILALVVLVLFGRGRISEMMGDFGKGIKSFKEGMSEETNRPVTPPARYRRLRPEPPLLPPPLKIARSQSIRASIDTEPAGLPRCLMLVLRNCC
jgi:sec-independent protein translocase protein TatA